MSKFQRCDARSKWYTGKVPEDVEQVIDELGIEEQELTAEDQATIQAEAEYS